MLKIIKGCIFLKRGELVMGQDFPEFKGFEPLPPLIDEINNSNNKKQKKAESLESVELPSFDDEKTFESQSFHYEQNQLDNNSLSDLDLDIPRPPKELKSKGEYLKLQDIEDEYLETNVTNQDILNAESELKEFAKKQPLFVNVEDYGAMLNSIKGSKSNFKTFYEKFQTLDNISQTKQTEIEKMTKTLEAIQRRIISIDNHLFEKEGE